MKIKVYSLKELNQHLGIKNIISVRDPGKDFLYKDIDTYCSNILPVYFDDVTHYAVKSDMIHIYYKMQQKTRNFIYFDENIAMNIKNFSDKIFFRGQDLNIHCFAGKSRSQAIAQVLNNYYNLYIEQNYDDFLYGIKENNFRYHGNYQVQRILKDVLYLKNNTLMSNSLKY